MEGIHENKLGINQVILSTGIIGEYDLENNDFIRVTIENANAGNVISLLVRVTGESSYTSVKTINGASSARIETNSYDELQIQCSTLDGTNVKIIASGFKLG